MPYIPPQYENSGSAFFKALSEGVQKDIIEPEQQRQAAKLQLALESAKMEQEMKLRAQAMTIPQGEFGQITGGLGKMIEGETGSPAPDFSSISSLPGQQAALGGLKEMALGANRGNGLQFLPVRDAQGNVNYMPTSKKTGKQGKPISGGLSQDASNKARQATQGFYEANGLLSSIKDTILPELASVAQELPGQYAKLKLNDIIQNHPNVSAYLSALPATTQRLGFALTGAIGADRSPGFLEKQTQELPQAMDTVPTAIQKLKQMDFLFRNRMNSEFKAMGINPPVPEFTHVDQHQSGGSPVNFVDAASRELQRRKASSQGQIQQQPNQLPFMPKGQ